MNVLLKAVSYLFHPLWMPFLGSAIYFLITPRYFPDTVVKAKLLAISIMSIFIPVVFFFMLRTLGKVSSHFLEDARERPMPLGLYAAVTYLIMKYVLDLFDYPELYFYFFGILISALLCLLLLYFQQKTSLHMVGLGGLIMFLILLSLHFGTDLIYTISFFLAITGLTASSRLHYKAHTALELFTGLLIGLLPQMLLAFLWL